MQDVETGKMEALDQEKMDEAEQLRAEGDEQGAEELEQQAKDEAQPDRLRQGQVMREGQEVSIVTQEGSIYMRAKVHSIGKSRIMLEPLPGEAKSAGVKKKKGRVKK